MLLPSAIAEMKMLPITVIIANSFPGAVVFPWKVARLGQANPQGESMGSVNKNALDFLTALVFQEPGGVLVSELGKWEI